GPSGSAGGSAARGGLVRKPAGVPAACDAAGTVAAMYGGRHTAGVRYTQEKADRGSYALFGLQKRRK
ncbi:MAG: hypothetical protein LBB61_04880, partial [Treponema sp.]|nr:hypothetical protein [Treponema sp.]